MNNNNVRINKPREQPLVKPVPENTSGKIETIWFYSKEEIEKHSPSRKYGFSYEAECLALQQGAAFVRTVADRLNSCSQREAISHLSISVALIQMRRFFLVHDLEHFDPRDIGIAALFLSCKSEECPRRLELFVLVTYRLRIEMELSEDQWEKESAISKEMYNMLCEYILWNESLILKTVGK